MSLVLTAEGQWAQVTGLSIPSTVGFTACGFWLPTADTNTYQVCFDAAILGTGSYYTITTTVDGTSMGGWHNSWNEITGDGIDLNRGWHFWAIVKSGSTIRFASIGSLNGASVVLGRPLRWVTYSQAVTSIDTNMIRIGNWVSTNTYTAFGRHTGVKLWGTALSDQEITREAFSLFPIRRSKILGAWPLDARSGLFDVSGNGKHLTITGGSFAIDAPINLPLNDIDKKFKNRLYKSYVPNYTFSYPSADVSNNGWTRVG